MKTRVVNSKNVVEETLLQLLGENESLTITRPALAQEAGVSEKSISRTNAWLVENGKWEITLGYGRSETTYLYLGK